MIASFLRTILVCAFASGMMAPKVSVALAELIPGMHTAVICTGSELLVLIIDNDGQPVEVPQSRSEHCVLADIVSSGAGFTAPWMKFALDFRFRFVVKLHPAPSDELFDRKWPSRAPPVTI